MVNIQSTVKLTFPWLKMIEKANISALEAKILLLNKGSFVFRMLNCYQSCLRSKRFKATEIVYCTVDETKLKEPFIHSLQNSELTSSLLPFTVTSFVR